MARRVARRTGWVVKTNPYEGGSDHAVFGASGVPSVLDWHFTDRNYHTSFDTPDKTSPQEMRNVGVAAGASAWLLASRIETNALAVADPAAARTRESTILAAWRKWYGEAVRSASRLVAGGGTAAFTDRLDRLASAFAPRGAGGAVGISTRGSD